MTFGLAVFIGSIAVLLVLSLFFIGCRRYEDGIVGNVALGFLCIACGVVLWDAWEGRLQIPAPPYLLIILCVAVFMARHAWRFAMFHWHGWFGWRPPRDSVAEHQ